MKTIKIFGYVDDLINWFINFQLNAGWWNILIIFVEVFVLLLIYRFVDAIINPRVCL